jgi:hypothetical protein
MDNFKAVKRQGKYDIFEKNELVVLGEKRGRSLPDAAISI